MQLKYVCGEARCTPEYNPVYDDRSDFTLSSPVILHGIVSPEAELDGFAQAEVESRGAHLSLGYFAWLQCVPSPQTIHTSANRLKFDEQ